jgi:hypothetical protein
VTDADRFPPFAFLPDFFVSLLRQRGPLTSDSETRTGSEGVPFGSTPPTTLPYPQAHDEVLPTYTSSALGGPGGGRAMESKIKMRCGEDADEMLLEKRVLRRSADTGVSPTSFAVTEHSPTSPSPNVLFERTMSSLAASLIFCASSSLSTCRGVEKKLERVLSNSDVCRVFRRHVLPFELRFVGIDDCSGFTTNAITDHEV